MIENEPEVRAGAEMASELLLDLGDFITGGRLPPRWLRWLAWGVTLLGAFALWRRFEWLFDHYPAWAVISAGLWGMMLIAAVGLWAAGIKYGIPLVRRSDRDLPSNER